MERLKQKEIQAQQMEEQRQQFKLKTQNLLRFHEEVVEHKTPRVGRKKKDKASAGEVYSDGEEEVGTSQATPGKKR